MTQAEAVKAILQRWMQQWPTLSGGVPYAFDDDVIDEPPTGYARVSINLDDSDEQYTLGQPGNRKYLRTGTVSVKLFGPANRGRGPLDAQAQLVRAVYQSQRIGATGGTEDGVVLYATSSKELRARSDAQWWLLLVSTPFEFFEVA